MSAVYVIGSLRNTEIPRVAAALRVAGHDAFDDWYSPGPDADDHLRDYEAARGHDFIQALDGWAARHIFEFDRAHLDRCDAAVLVLPAGRSCHLELGYVIGRGKPGYILMEQDPERIDLMYNFATAVCRTVDQLVERLR